MTTPHVYETIEVRLLYFAQLRDRFGESELFSLPKGARGQDLMSRLGERIPSLVPLLKASRLAVNCEYADRDQVLQEGDEVAIILPVSGG